jgi:hypothetical protein
MPPFLPPTRYRSSERAHDSESVTTDNIEGTIRTVNLVDYPIHTQDSYKKLCQVVHNVGLLKILAEATTVKIGELGIRNLQECSTCWMDKHFVEEKYGLVIDPQILLDCLFGDDAMDPITQLKTMDTMSKINIYT